MLLRSTTISHIYAVECRFKTLLTKDELAGLACCPDVEARVVTGGRYVDNAGKDWELEHGPFEEEVSYPQP